jgi:hypothetical protein
MGLLGDDVDVIGEGEGDHIGLQTVDHRPGLFSGAAMGLPDGDGIPGTLLPMLCEGLVEVLVELPGGVIGDIEELDFSGVG